MGQVMEQPSALNAVRFSFEITDELRKRMAVWMSGATDGRHGVCEAYEATDGDSDFWVVDAGNNWYLNYDKDRHVVKVMSRNASPEGVDALTRWFAYRWLGEPIRQL
jgi:hypothetical protein